MPERWERELRKLRDVEVDEPTVRERIERGPSPEGHRSRRERLVAGAVAFAVFVAAGAFVWNAFSPTLRRTPLPSDGDVSTGLPSLSISVRAEPGQADAPEALARFGTVEALIPVQGGKGWGMGNAFPSAMFGPLDAAIPVGAPVVIESNAEQLSVGFNDAYPEGGLVPQPITSNSAGILPSDPGDLLIQVDATWPEGRGEFSIFVHLYEPVDVLDVDCRANRVPVWQSRVVRAQPDGIHAEFDADASRELRIDAPGFGPGPVARLEPSSTSFELPIPPGIATLGCNNVPDSQITVVDPEGFWAHPELQCVAGDKVMRVAAEESNERLIDAAVLVEQLVDVHVRDEILPPGYPKQPRDEPLPVPMVVQREGRTVATLDVWLGLPGRIEGQSCESAGLHAKADRAPAPSPSPSPSAAESAEVVVRIEGLGRSEATRRWPVMTVSFGGETYRGCTEAFEWTTADLTRIEEVSGRSGSILVQCSNDPLFVVPPRAPIVVLAESGTDVFVTRTTTPLYTGIDGVGVSVTWPDGSGDFLAYFDVRNGEPGSRQVVLDCPTDDRVPFSTPDGPRILPGGSAYIRGNMAGFRQTDVIEQMTREQGGTTEWDGVWQVVRGGSVIAAVEFGSLQGVACRGSGIGGV